MKIRVKQGQSAVIATHVGQGDERRMLFITPWGCSLSTPRQAPSGVDVSPREYVIDVTGEAERLLVSALKAGHPGLKDKIEVFDVKSASKK